MIFSCVADSCAVTLLIVCFMYCYALYAAGTGFVMCLVLILVVVCCLSSTDPDGAVLSVWS